MNADAWSQLGDAMNVARLFPEAGEAHEAAAERLAPRTTRPPKPRTTTRWYLDACAAGKWTEAADAVLKAAAVDESKYQPFPLYVPDHPVFNGGRYEPLHILGGGAFGTVFLCNDHNNPIPNTTEFLRVGDQGAPL